jgi:hypothetical protein
MSWYYYLEGEISFPFRARCVAANAVSPLRKGEPVEVLRMAVEDACEHDMLVQIRWRGRKMAIPLSQLDAINPDESTNEAISDWHYWSPRAIVSDLRTAAESSGSIRFHHNSVASSITMRSVSTIRSNKKTSRLANRPQFA